MDELQKLAEKLRLIEALHAGTTFPGERTAAENARQRIKDKMEEYKQIDPPVEYTFSMTNMWSRKLLLALLRRYGIQPYRYYRQRYTTVRAKVSKTFVDKTLWPEYKELNSELTAHLDKISERIINESIFNDSSEAEEINMISNEN